jgi:hypothetical protein
MDKMLGLYKAVAERETGFWVGLPVATGHSVSRKKWLRLMKEDPTHFQIAILTTEELTGYSTGKEDLIECAVFVIWLHERVH